MTNNICSCVLTIRVSFRCFNSEQYYNTVMELIIYGTFLALSLLAYGARQVAKKGDEKKTSVSNINFKRFVSIVCSSIIIIRFVFVLVFRRVSSLSTSLPCWVTGCKVPMSTSSMLSMVSRNLK